MIEFQMIHIWVHLVGVLIFSHPSFRNIIQSHRKKIKNIIETQFVTWKIILDK